MIRPEIAALFRRYGEVLATTAATLFGIWVASWGGLFFLILGGLIALVAAAFALVAARRLRFLLGVDAPGVVEIDEGKVSYMGPVFGGYIALSELAELQVLDVAGQRRCWRLKQADGQALLIPLAAQGAPALYDAFAVLPGLDANRLRKAATLPADTPVTVWRQSFSRG